MNKLQGRSIVTVHNLILILTVMIYNPKSQIIMTSVVVLVISGTTFSDGKQKARLTGETEGIFDVFT